MAVDSDFQILMAVRHLFIPTTEVTPHRGNHAVLALGTKSSPHSGWWGALFQPHCEAGRLQPGAPPHAGPVAPAEPLSWVSCPCPQQRLQTPATEPSLPRLRVSEGLLEPGPLPASQPGEWPQAEPRQPGLTSPHSLLRGQGLVRLLSSGWKLSFHIFHIFVWFSSS